MRAIATDALLALSTAVIWFACLGFLRLRAPLDRLHAASFAGVVAAPLLLIAALVAQGASSSVLSVLFLAVTLLVGGAGLTHAVGRAIYLRDRQGGGSL